MADGNGNGGWFSGMKFTMKDMILIVGFVAGTLGGYYKGQRDSEAQARTIAAQAVANGDAALIQRLAGVERDVSRAQSSADAVDERLDHFLERGTRREGARDRVGGQAWQ